MAFDNVTFPSVALVHDITRQTIDPVSIVGNGYKEYRVSRTKWERYIWTIPTRVLNSTKQSAIAKFLSEREHSKDAFKFADPLNNTVTDMQLTFRSGTTWWLYCPHQGTNTVNPRHPMFHPGTLVLEVGGTPTAFTTTKTALGAYVTVTGTNSGSVVTISGDYAHAVRLDSIPTFTAATLTETNAPYLFYSGDLVLSEVWEYA